MARMHSRKKGKAKSRKPVERTKAEWVTLKEKEIQDIIKGLADEGNSPSKIGLILRDQYGIPDVKPVMGKKLNQVLNELGVKQEIPEDLLALVKKAVMIRKHLETNHKDQPGVRGLRLTESKIMRLTKYYKSTGKVAQTWNYNPKEASYLAE